MKKNLFLTRTLAGMLAFMLAFSMAVVACDDGSGNGSGGNNNGGGGSGGTFTVTGFPSEYNGKYVSLFGEEEENSAVDIYGYVTANMSTGAMTLPRISNGSVTIPLWTDNGSDEVLSRYSGNASAFFYFSIWNTAEPTEDEDLFEIAYFDSVSFTNGNATKSWSDRTLFDDDDWDDDDGDW